MLYYFNKTCTLSFFPCSVCLCVKCKEIFLCLISKNMDNKSILDQIISNHKAEDVANLDAIEIINNLFDELSERERDVLIRRFGLYGKNRETLEEIGKVHQLTRERIRQIETFSVKKLRQLNKLDEHVSGLKNVINQLLEEHGGIMERRYLLNALVNFSINGVKPKPEDINIHKSHLDFLISKLLHNDLEEIAKSEYFNKFFKLKFSAIDHLEELAEELLEKIKETKKIFLTEDLIQLAKKLNYYTKHEDKFNTPDNLDVSNILGGDYFNENASVINKNKIIYSIMQALKNLEQNKFGYWGMDEWRDIKPKTINDKIYLVLKHNGKPMHFVKIAEEINKIGFDNKKANAATVHNELILDKKYVLIGRGLYGLKDWGYQQGTVADIIEDILKKSETTLNREEIIEKVLEQRIVKKATVNLALMNKQKFEKTEYGKYKLKLT